MLMLMLLFVLVYRCLTFFIFCCAASKVFFMQCAVVGVEKIQRCQKKKARLSEGKSKGERGKGEGGRSLR